ncbi:HAD family hydrolase [Streptomyces sp. NPDC048172]|uniref:HAD family hydrolase n=1 Tax=Streptomyces sp. NPDC048172 TaxID=3365505 RepID=UPI003723ACDB
MPYKAVIFDFGGVLTTNLDETARVFARESGLPEDAYLHAVSAHPTGRHLNAQLERGEISQEAWNTGIAALLGIDGTDLMRRALATLHPEPALVELARAIRTAGLKTAVLSNSMGMNPFNPYEPWDLYERHDVVVLSEEVRMRKPERQIYEITLERLGHLGHECIFVDDIEANFHPARELGITPVLATEPTRTVQQLRQLVTPSLGS